MPFLLGHVVLYIASIVGFFLYRYSQLYRKDGENEWRVASREKSSSHIQKKRVAEKALFTFFS